MTRRSNYAVIVFLTIVLIGIAIFYTRHPVASQQSGNTSQGTDKPVFSIQSSSTSQSQFQTTVIEVQSPIYYEGLTVFPLVMKQKQGMNYTILEDAIKEGEVEITEVDESGSVPTLMLKNKGNRKVMVIDGEEVVGAKQNRIINLSMLIPEKSNIQIPVSCVEHGRWTLKTESFSDGAMANANTRAYKSKRVQDNIVSGNGYAADQSEVWDNVAELNSKIAAEAPTGALHDGYKTRELDLDKYMASINLPENANGYIAFAGVEPLGADIFDKPYTLQRKWKKLLQSVAIEVIGLNEKPVQATMDDARQFLREATASVGSSYSPPGTGVGFHIQSDTVVGNILTYDGIILHVSFFRNKVESMEKRGDMNSAPNIEIR